MLRLISRFAADESGATAIEYAMIAGGICVVIITVVQGLGTNINGKYGLVSSSLK